MEKIYINCKYRDEIIVPLVCISPNIELFSISDKDKVGIVCLMKDGIGDGMTREDHSSVSSQLFASYSKVKSIRSLAAIIGEEELSSVDKQYLAFGDAIESQFFSQGEYENRSIEETLDLGWKLLKLLPQNELYRIKPEFIEKYLPKDEEQN